jgi:integrase/recombinase XerD
MKVMGFNVFKEVRKGVESKNFYIDLERGLRRSLGTGDKDDAIARAEILVANYYKSEITKVENKGVSLDNFKKEFLESKAHLAPGTTRMYSLSISSLRLSCGNKKLHDIGDREVQKWINSCLSRMKPVSLNSYITHLRVAFLYAVDQGYIEQPPKTLKRIKVPKRLPATFTTEELKEILAKAKNSYPDMYRVINFAMWSLCRKAEILSLDYQDINFRTEKIRIIGKGDKERHIPLTEGARKAIGIPRDIGPVFRQYHPATVSRYFKEILRSVGINDERHFHNLRHTGACTMLENEIPIEIVSEMLGHEELRTTKIYAKIALSRLRKEIKKFDYGL